VDRRSGALCCGSDFEGENAVWYTFVMYFTAYSIKKDTNTTVLSAVIMSLNE
jgi:hypothetical protein